MISADAGAPLELPPHGWPPKLLIEVREGRLITPSRSAHAVTFRCQASALGQKSQFTLVQPIDTDAPATAAPGSPVRMVITPLISALPSSSSGHRVNHIKNIALRLAVPTNAHDVSASLSGGLNLGGTPTVARDGEDIVLSVPGPLAGGTEFQLPQITLDLRAGRSGTITTRLRGTSYTDPGLEFTVNVRVGFFPVDVPARGYPDPNPVLATTRIR